MASIGDVVNGHRVHGHPTAAKYYSTYRSESVLPSPRSTAQMQVGRDRGRNLSPHAKGVLHLRALIVPSILNSSPIWAPETYIATNGGGEFVDCALNPHCLLRHDLGLDPLDQVKLLEQPKHQLLVQRQYSTQT